MLLADFFFTNHILKIPPNGALFTAEAPLRHLPMPELDTITLTVDRVEAVEVRMEIVWVDVYFQSKWIWKYTV